jgi:hypothetical protein
MPIVGPLEEFGVRRHVVTVAILSIALALYATDLSGLGIAALIAGAAFELWFWVRLIGRRPPASDPDAQPAK